MTLLDITSEIYYQSLKIVNINVGTNHKRHIKEPIHNSNLKTQYPMTPTNSNAHNTLLSHK